MGTIKVIPSRDLRNNYHSVVSMLNDNDRIIVTNHGKGQAVLINFDDYQHYEEYLHYRYVSESLKAAEDYAKDKESQWLTHDDFWADI